MAERSPSTPLGKVPSQGAVGPFSVWESHPPPGLEAEDHHHGQSSLCIVLRGGYFEGPSREWIGAGCAAFAPANSGGRVELGPQGAWTLLVEGPEGAWRDLLGLHSLPAVPVVRSETSGLGIALVAGLRRSGSDLPELLAGLGAAWSDVGRLRGPLPGYLRRALRRIEEGLGEPWSLSALAQDVGVHRGTLARAFRGHLETTVGRYLQDRRLGRAAKLIARGQEVVEVAAECGFADQSHLTRLFHARFGTPPARFRRILGKLD